MLLAMATDAGKASFVGASIFSQQSVFNMNVYPSPIPGMDEELDPTGDPGPGDQDGTAEQFSINKTIYDGTSFWPSAEGVDGTVGPQNGAIPGASVAGWPVSFLPPTQRLMVNTSAQYSFDHIGNLIQLPCTLTKLKDKEYRFTFKNWNAVQPMGFGIEPFDYHSRYLIVANPSWSDTLAPFVQMKGARAMKSSSIRPR